MHTHKSKCDNRKLNGHIEKIILNVILHDNENRNWPLSFWNTVVYPSVVLASMDNDLLNCILININYSN